MIPFLINADETDYKNPEGQLIFLQEGTISCLVTEERNGMYELKMVFSANDEKFSEIQLDKIIVAKPNDTDEPQMFRVYRITKPINNRSTVYAEHISYRLAQVPVRLFDRVNVSAQSALNALKTNAMVECPFTFASDIATTANYSVTEPSSLKSKLVGEQGSILQVYGGEYKYDNFSVSLLQSRGSDNGVQLLYGRNITDLSQDEDASKMYSGVCPYWEGIDEETGDELITMLPEEVVYADNHELFPYEKIMSLDLSDKFEVQPTVAQLRSAANAYITDNGLSNPDVSISVSFVPLWQTQEYTQLKELERVSLCDTVTVIYKKLGIISEAKVVKTVYDCLKERYESVSIGTIKQNFAGTMSGVVNTQNDTNRELKTAIEQIKRRLQEQ